MATWQNPHIPNFQKQSVPKTTYKKLLSEVVSQFHLNQIKYLPIFFPKPHSNTDEQLLHVLDVRLCLAFYLERTKPFCSLCHVFVSYADHTKGWVISSWTISSWITSFFCNGVWSNSGHTSQRSGTHSTGPQVMSVALLNYVSILNICRAAPRSSTRTFTKHYAIMAASRLDANFRRQFCSIL